MLDIWDKEYIDPGKWTEWPFHDIDPRSCLWHGLAKTCMSAQWNFQIWDAACWAHFMCHHELWSTSVSHSFSSLNSSLDLAGGKHCQKITIPIFRLVLQNFTIPGCFPYIIFYCYLFSLLSSGWFVIAICGSISVWGQLILMGALTFLCFFYSKLWPVDCGLSIWGKIMMPMYKLWLYGVYGPCCLLSSEKPLNLITHSLHNKVRTTHPITTKCGNVIALVIVITWLNFGEVLNFLMFWRILYVFFQGRTYFGHISGMVVLIDVKGKASVVYWV